MGPNSPNVTYSDGDSEVLWEDGERIFRRGWRLDDNGKPRAVLFVLAAAEHPSRSSLDRLTHEYELRDELDPAWAARPLELVRDAGRAILVLEDTGGKPLDRPPDPMEVGHFLSLAIAIAAALGKLHQRGLVHKDIKPANILVNDATGEVRLTGFGIASRLARERQSPHPPETIAGTLAYMAPEQTGRMNRSIDSRSDLYALGVTFYQMLTGALPFSAADPMEWVHCHLARRPVAPAERLRDIPGVVSEIVMKLLAKMAEDRYQTAAGLEYDLRRCESEWEAQRRIDDFALGEHDTPDRLLIPEKLYGRQGEVETLLAAFDRIVKGGAPELVLVSGYSGIGKSSVVNEFRKGLLPPRGLFASGKFDQNKRDLPYATFAQAFQGLVGMILAESEAEHARYRDAIREAIEPHGQFIVNLTPELERVIGKQAPIAELAPQDAPRVFEQVLRRFIGVFARTDCPLALFLDDLQWLDTGTLGLLQHLLLQEEVKSLLLVAAYRDNEVGPEHPLRPCLEAIRRAGVAVTEIQLAPLALSDVSALIAGTLRDSRVLPLAERVHDKTAGNPLFATQFLTALADDGLIAFDRHTLRWIWDESRIAARSFTDNVVDLMIEKVARQPPPCHEAMQAMACIGNTVRMHTLAAALDASVSCLHTALRPAVEAGLVSLQNETYSVLHDRIQEASYALIPETERASAHLRAGRRLLARTPHEKLDEDVFEIVNQLNRGIALVSDREELDRIAELNARAGQRAKAATATVTALALLRTGAAVLGEAGWERRRGLAFTLAFEQAECEFLLGDLEQAEARLSALAGRAEGPRELAAVACLRIMLYVTAGEPARSVDVCLEYLEHEGIHFASHPSREDVERELERMWRALGSRSIEDLSRLPETNDAATLATLDVLAAAASPAWFSDPLLPALIGARIANISIERGCGPATSFGYAMLGMKLGPLSGDYRTAYRLATVALELAERDANPRTLARVLFGYTMFVRPWADTLDGCRELLYRGFEMAERGGDVTYATYLLCNVEELMLIAGSPLEDTEAACRRALAYARKLKFDFAGFAIQTQLGLTRMLRGSTKHFGSFDSCEFDQHVFEQTCGAVPALALPLCWYWIRRQQALFLAGDPEGSLAAAEAAEPVLWLVDVYFQFAEHHFYGALARAECLDRADEAARPNLRARLEAHVAKLAQFGEHSPTTLGSRAALAAAELARIEGREQDAMTLYERAFRSARAAGFAHIEALSFELAARFYGARGFETIANSYLREARSCYRRWGAGGKVRQLEALHPFLREPESAPAAATIAAPIEHLDLATVIKVSQAVSGEMVLEKMIDTLMRLAVEYAGAERGLLLLSQADGLRQEAEATIGGDGITVHQGDASASAFPEAVVHYVRRSRESVILDDASAHPIYSSDPYVREHKARSILCLPLVNESKVSGVLYLENDLASHAFSPDRVTVLKVLASQAAISLENSRLYRDLADREAKIRRREEATRVALDTVADGGPLAGMLELLCHTMEQELADRVIACIHPVDEDGTKFLDTVAPSLGKIYRDTINGISVSSMIGPCCHAVATRQTIVAPDLADPKWAQFQEYAKPYGFRSAWSRPILSNTGNVLGTFAHFYSEARDPSPRDERMVELLTRAAAVAIERSRSERTLRELNETLEQRVQAETRERLQIWNVSQDFLVIAALDGTILSANPTWTAVLGWSDSDLLHQSYELFVHPDDLEKTRAEVGRLGRGHKTLHFENRLRDKNGAYHWISWAAAADSGRLYCMGRDFTEYKRAEAALRESERSLRSAIDGIPGLVAILAPNGEVEAVNRQIVEYCGQPLEELRNWGTNGIVYSEDLPQLAEIFTTSITSGTSYEFEARLRRRDGEYRWFNIRGIPVHDTSDHITRWYALLTDVEDRTRALTRLQQMQSDFAHLNRVSMMGELAASLSHEITQPIASVRNNARAALNFLNRQPVDVEEVQEALDCIVGDTDRAGDIIGRIRDQIKKAPQRKTYFDLDVAIDEVIGLARSAILRNGVAVQTRLAGALSPVHGDRVQLQQVVLNLILNAVEAMGSVASGGRELLVSTASGQRGFIVAVRDSGPGIDPNHVEHIFEAFYTTKPSGVGMGLSICRSIIAAHGGRLWAEGNKPRGAVFQFTLPRTEANHELPSSALSDAAD